MVGVQWDLTLVIVQVLLSFFKLLIASFLLWLIVDLFILRPIALTETTWGEFGGFGWDSIGWHECFGAEATCAV